jgi:hypothetical protein
VAWMWHAPIGYFKIGVEEANSWGPWHSAWFKPSQTGSKAAQTKLNSNFKPVWTSFDSNKTFLGLKTLK